MSMIPIFVATNLVVLMFCAWIALSDEINTGVWGTLGFAVVGMSAMVNLIKPIRSPELIDTPETTMLIGMSIVIVWALARKVYWWKRGKKHEHVR
ncbi:holin [Burkholderia glumae]|nr:holin [Burkholderia glumae]